MSIYLFVLALLLLVSPLLLLAYRDRWLERALWRRLKEVQPSDPARFDPSLVADLPEPAQRFFRFAIAAGTPLRPVAELEMGGEFSLGSREAPSYRPMLARQILAAPVGFVWAMRLQGGLPVSGFDAIAAPGSWTRFAILGLIPVARLGGDPDHYRSAFGRCIAEAVFWTPAALLPGDGIQWQAVDTDVARVTVRQGELSQAVDIQVGADGRLVSVSFLRWSNANPDKRYRWQAFGGTLSDYRSVDGYCLPFRVEAGNLFGTDDYFPFFKAQVSAIRFPGSPG